MEKKKHNLKISIITVCYNSEKTIRYTIESLISQEYKDIEYIVIDGGSTDQTLEIIKEYNNSITFLSSEIDNGIYDAMNKGINVAKGKIIGILNSDDFYPNNFIISNVVNSFNNKIDAVYGDLVYVDPINTKKVLRYWKSGTYTREKIKNGWMLPHPTFFVRKTIYDKYGLYDSSLHQAADYAIFINFVYKNNIPEETFWYNIREINPNTGEVSLWFWVSMGLIFGHFFFPFIYLLFYKNKINVAYIPEILVHMRNGGKSNKSIFNRFKGNKEDLLAWKLNNLSPPRFIRFKKPLHKIKQFFQKPK